MTLSLLRFSQASICLLFFTSIIGCEDAKIQKVKAPTPHVIVETVSQSNIKPQMEFIGRTEATEDVSIRAQVEGTLLKRHFTGGDDVNKGELLFEIDPRPYITVVEQQKAALIHAKSAFKIAKNRWERGTKLSKTGAISEMDIDELTAQMNQTQADVAINQAALDTAELNLSYTRILAPISGRISRSQVSIGDLITANNLELATLVQLDPVWVNFQIAEKQLSNARQSFADGTSPIQTEDLTVTIQLSEQLDYNQPGKIDFIDNRVDQSTGTLAIRAIFPNPDKLMLPGQYTNLTIGLPDAESVVLISQASVQEEQQGRFVLVVNEQNKVEKRMVKLGARYDVRWEVTEGVEVGEKIIIEGLQKVRIGIEVETTESIDKPFSASSETK
ncbi:efflux RND transporter periplasmic adaptor subunit [Psychromonas ossibalaenae]|uniref:efflux RND transporter periplasmic adaptor subunit n=1 Tax=Psychromonas ossibalaenae TaxID=444922 RepID=UPI0003829B9A|nr:efflux RND transporter periplasmic adaptor subunit [Psychromonas ossibalaenae]